MGTPSWSSVKVMTLRACDRSDVSDAKRVTSWFSEKVPRSVESLHVDLTVLISEARSEMEPEEDVKVRVRG